MNKPIEPTVTPLKLFAHRFNNQLGSGKVVILIGLVILIVCIATVLKLAESESGNSIEVPENAAH